MEFIVNFFENITPVQRSIILIGEFLFWIIEDSVPLLILITKMGTCYSKLIFYINDNFNKFFSLILIDSDYLIKIT